jgi:molecular chaperone DnaK
MAENQIYGIDLGTTYSCIAYVDEHGKPVVVPNADNDMTTPSVVYFESPGNIVVGETAKEVAETYPKQVISTVKRVMGDTHWEFEYEGRTYTPQEISSHILRKVVADAEANTGHKIKEVVITVPAYFGVNQKEATKQAGELAGLDVLYVIPEPTAAAISYGMEQEEDQVILVYDLGGGTFDITVIEVKKGAITVICTGGDSQLGGRDWDEALALYFAQCFSDETGISTDELTENPETWQELLNSAEKCKKALSTRTSLLEKVSHEGERVKVELTRDKFEEITSSFLEKTLSLTEEVLQIAKDKGYARIDKLLLVGGSTYMPQVKEKLEQKFLFEIRLFDPNQSVAKGAAIFGYKCYLDEQIKIAIAEETGQVAKTIDLDLVDKNELKGAQEKVAQTHGVALAGLKKLTETRITNVTSKSFGIVVVINEEGDEGVQNLIMVDDIVPTTITQTFPTFADNQEGVNLRCMENIERKGPDDAPLPQVDETQEIGHAELSFSRPLPKGSPVEITFSLAADGLLSIHGKDLTTYGEIDAEFKTESILSREELEEKKKHNLAINVSS